MQSLAWLRAEALGRASPFHLWLPPLKGRQSQSRIWDYGKLVSQFFACTWQVFNLRCQGFWIQIFRLSPLNLLTDDSPRGSTEKVLVAQPQECVI